MPSTTDTRLVNHPNLEMQPTSHCLILVCTGGFQLTLMSFKPSSVMISNSGNEHEQSTGASNSSKFT